MSTSPDHVLFSKWVWTNTLRRLSRGLGGATAGELASARLLLAWLPIWLLLLINVGGLFAAYQLVRPYSVRVGTPQDEAYVRNFHTRLQDADRAYRWSDVYGYVSFPGVGGGRPFTISMQIDPGRTAPVTLIVNGQTLYSRTLQTGWHEITLVAGPQQPAIINSRDVVVEVRAPGYYTPDSPSEVKGVKVSSVRLEQGGGGFVVPAVATLVFLALAVLLVYVLAGRALLGLAASGRARSWGLAVAALTAAALVSALAWNHAFVSADALHLCITLVSTLALMIVVDRVLAERWTGNPGAARVLALATGLAFAVRYGGMALPQSVIIDMPYHMKWLRTLLIGDWQSLYFPGGLSEVPREWGLNVLIPKSPLFYFAFAPLGALPLDLEATTKWLICFMDSTLVLAVAWICRRAGASYWAAALAGGEYAFMPLVFRAFSYGILPTIFAQWLATGVFAYLLWLGPGRWPVRHWVGLLLLLTLALLAFPTVALFVSLVIVASAVIWAMANREWRAALWRLSLLLVVAWGIALVSYYGLYVEPVLTSISALLAPRPGGGTTVRWPGGFPELVAWTADYVVSLLPGLLALLGVLLLFSRGRAMITRRYVVWLLAAWLAIAPLFFLVNYRVDMIGKHLFFTMAPIAVGAGIALWALARRNRWGTLLALIAFATITWQALLFWLDRLVATSS